MESVAEYTARIKAHVEGKDPIAVQRESYEVIASLVEGLSREAVDRPWAPGKWSTREILAHLADVEVANAWRYRQILQRSGVVLTPFDQDEWAKLGDYSKSDAKESLELFRMLRKNNLALFARLGEEEWQRFGMHTERGKLTLKELVTQMAGHDLNHIAQLREAAAKAGC